MKKIFVVDDDPELLFSVTALLRRKNFEVISVSDCRNAVALILEIYPDLVLLDINLGPCDGRDICNHLKVIKQLPIPILLFSANDEAQLSLDKIKADGFIQKPFDTCEFIDLIHEKLIVSKQTDHQISGGSTI